MQRTYFFQRFSDFFDFFRIHLRMRSVQLRVIRREHIDAYAITYENSCTIRRVNVNAEKMKSYDVYSVYIDASATSHAQQLIVFFMQAVAVLIFIRMISPGWIQTRKIDTPLEIILLQHTHTHTPAHLVELFWTHFNRAPF